MRLVRLNRALGDAFGSVEAVIAFLRTPDASTDGNDHWHRCGLTAALMSTMSAFGQERT